MGGLRRAVLLLGLAACDAAPIAHTPVAVDVTVTTIEDTPVRVSLPGTDPDGELLRWTVTGPTHGALSGTAPALTYTPDPDFAGDDAIQVAISDGAGATTASVAIVVTPVPDPPIAYDDQLETPEDVALVLPASSLTANDVDPDGDLLTVTQVTAVRGGTVTLFDGAIVFAPTPDVSGTAAFTYTVSDGMTVASAQVEVAVAAVDDPPQPIGDELGIREDALVGFSDWGLMANDSDPEGDVLTIVAVGDAIGGTVWRETGAVRFQPDPDRTDPASFRYTVSDGVATASAIVSMSITPVNDPPIAVDDAVTAIRDTPRVMSSAELLANDHDVDGDALQIVGVDGATGGAVALDADQVTFTPAPGFVGTGGFAYTLSDGTVTASGAVTVTVTD